MKNNITEIVFILDRSGSMSGYEEDTIGGFNATIEKQKKLDGTCYVSTVMFANQSCKSRSMRAICTGRQSHLNGLSEPPRRIGEPDAKNPL